MADLLNHLTNRPKTLKIHNMHLQVFLCMCVCRYRLAGLPGDYQEKNISSPETNYCLLKDLIIWTQYQIQVAAYTGAGLGVYSSPVTEYTLQGGEYRCTHTHTHSPHYSLMKGIANVSTYSETLCQSSAHYAHMLLNICILT